MKTCLFTLSYLDGVDKSGSSRLERNIKYLNYYWPLRKEFGFQTIAMVDNASSWENLHALQKAAPFRMTFEDTAPPIDAKPYLFEYDRIRFFRFSEHLKAGERFFKGDPRHAVDYPYVWRGFAFINTLFHVLGYEKVILIDSDCFVLSPRLAHHIRDLKTTWWTVHCPKYDFPDASIQVITKDLFLDHDWSVLNGMVMEKILPFSWVDYSFNCDRYGEKNLPVTPEMDFYGQAPVSQQMNYRWGDRQ